MEYYLSQLHSSRKDSSTLLRETQQHHPLESHPASFCWNLNSAQLSAIAPSIGASILANIMGLRGSGPCQAQRNALAPSFGGVPLLTMEYVSSAQPSTLVLPIMGDTKPHPAQQIPGNIHEEHPWPVMWVPEELSSIQPSIILWHPLLWTCPRQPHQPWRSHLWTSSVKCAGPMLQQCTLASHMGPRGPNPSNPVPQPRATHLGRVPVSHIGHGGVKPCPA